MCEYHDDKAQGGGRAKQAINANVLINDVLGTCGNEAKILQSATRGRSRSFLGIPFRGIACAQADCYQSQMLNSCLCNAASVLASAINTQQKKPNFLFLKTSSEAVTRRDEEGAGEEDERVPTGRGLIYRPASLVNRRSRASVWGTANNHVVASLQAFSTTPTSPGLSARPRPEP